MHHVDFQSEAKWLTYNLLFTERTFITDVLFSSAGECYQQMVRVFLTLVSEMCCSLLFRRSIPFYEKFLPWYLKCVLCFGIYLTTLSQVYMQHHRIRGSVRMMNSNMKLLDVACFKIF